MQKEIQTPYPFAFKLKLGQKHQFYRYANIDTCIQLIFCTIYNITHEEKKNKTITKQRKYDLFSIFLLNNKNNKNLL